MTQQSRAILLMIGAIFCFSIMDVAVKGLAPGVGILPALWARYVGQMLIVFVIVLPRLTQVIRTRHPVLQILRSILLMSATGFFFTGLSLIPLTDAAALMATNPVLITLGAALFLGERLGIRRVSGIAAAMLGAMIVIRPGSDVFTPAAFFPLAAAACYSGYALLTRRVGADEDVWTSLFYTGLVGTVILSLAVPFQWRSPDLPGIGLMGLVAMAGTIGQLALIRAFSLGEAAMLAPYSYVGLGFAAFWGFVFFSEIPDGWTVAGSLVIAAAGLYVWYRETFRNR
jgi:drug/metabolite transporter (DMT)-like permease